MPLAQNLHLQFSSIQYIDFFLRILIACLCGSCIGLERSKRLKEAGVRTHIIVCCATALMMIVSKYAFADLGDVAGMTLFGTKGADPSRIASQVVTGISFLGAGVIFKQHGAIKGLTTAAGLWATAGIGLAIGAGMYIMGLFTTGVMVVVQLLMHKFAVGADCLTTSQLQFIVRSEEDIQTALTEFTQVHRIQISDMKLVYLDDGYVSYDLLVRSPEDITADTLSRFLHERGEVRMISCSTVG